MYAAGMVGEGAGRGRLGVEGVGGTDEQKNQTGLELE